MIDVEVIENLFKMNTPFPESLKRLKEMGVERYFMDLVNMEKIYYSDNNESVRLPLKIMNTPAINSEMNEEKVVATLREIQQDKIDYPTFIRGIMDNGVYGYIVFLSGRKAVYLGRKGEMYTEFFPSNLVI